MYSTRILFDKDKFILGGQKCPERNILFDVYIGKYIYSLQVHVTSEGVILSYIYLQTIPFLLQKIYVKKVSCIMEEANGSRRT